jgi:hypothetical protein
MTGATQQSALLTIDFQAKKVVSISVLPLIMDRSSRQLRLANAATIKLIEDQLGVSKLKNSGVDLLLPAQ